VYDEHSGFAQDDGVQESLGANKMGRQAVTMEIGSTILDDSEIREYQQLLRVVKS